MENTSQPSSKAEWTLADFLSTYRYWGLFLASLLLAVGGQGLTTVLPLISRETGSSYQTVGIFYLGSNAGWIVGAFLAFVVASRHGRPALIVPLIVCAFAAVGVVPAPALWASPVFLFLFGLLFGTVRSVFPLAIAIFLVGGRPGKIDFGCALTLMSTTILTSAFAPIGASWLYQADQGGLPPILGFLSCLMIAVILLLPAQSLAFDDAPRQRHRPIAPQRRSPLMVAAILTTPVVLIFLLSLGVDGFQEASGYSEITLLLASLGVVIAIAAFLYLAYWSYRIHGELAGAAPSQRLLTPLAAMLIAILVPLGLPVLLMTLGDLLNDRGDESGKGRLISITWLAFWSFLFPPIAIALVQNAANKSYDGALA